MNKQFKEDVSPKVLKRIREAAEGYGKKQLLADKSGIRYNTLFNLIKDGKSTTSTVEKVLKGIKKMRA